jgi:rhodanese-related sulfurtransferase
MSFQINSNVLLLVYSCIFSIKKEQLMKIVLTILLCLFTSSILAATEFPGRLKYPHIPIIEIDDLYQSKNNVIIIDARSQYEYQTLRIKNAISVPLSLSTKDFKSRMEKIKADNPSKKLVFYCNGHSCMKSYKATRRSINYLGLKSVYAYDAGVFDWAKRYPDEAELLGETLKDPARLISKDNFKEHTLAAEKFIKSANSDVTILDIRGRIERDGFYIFSGDEISISLNINEKDKLDKFLDSINTNNKLLYVYDMVGKQVRWFQYYLESKNIQKYYFMDGGADAFFSIPIDKLMDQ